MSSVFPPVDFRIPVIYRYVFKEFHKSRSDYDWFESPQMIRCDGSCNGHTYVKQRGGKDNNHVFRVPFSRLRLLNDAELPSPLAPPFEADGIVLAGSEAGNFERWDLVWIHNKSIAAGEREIWVSNLSRRSCHVDGPGIARNNGMPNLDSRVLVADIFWRPDKKVDGMLLTMTGYSSAYRSRKDQKYRIMIRQSLSNPVEVEVFVGRHGRNADSQRAHELEDIDLLNRSIVVAEMLDKLSPEVMLERRERSRPLPLNVDMPEPSRESRMDKAGTAKLPSTVQSFAESPVAIVPPHNQAFHAPPIEATASVGMAAPEVATMTWGLSMDPPLPWWPYPEPVPATLPTTHDYSGAGLLSGPFSGCDFPPLPGFPGMWAPETGDPMPVNPMCCAPPDFFDYTIPLPEFMLQSDSVLAAQLPPPLLHQPPVLMDTPLIPISPPPLPSQQPSNTSSPFSGFMSMTRSPSPPPTPLPPPPPPFLAKPKKVRAAQRLVQGKPEARRARKVARRCRQG